MKKTKAKKPTHHHLQPELETNTPPASEATDAPAQAEDTAPESKPMFEVEEVTESQAPGDTYLDPESFPETEDLNPADSPEKSDTIQPPNQAEENPMTDYRPDTYSQEPVSPSETTTHHDFRLRPSQPRQFPWWLFVAGGLVLLIGLGLWKLVLKKPQPTQETPSVTDILVETTSASPSPKPEDKQLNREDFKLQVLNGSGIVGVAGKLASVLESAGFKDIDTSNAANYKYKGVTIRVKDGENDLGDLIESDLSDDYEDINVDDDLADDNDFDAVIILGSQPGDKKEEETEVLGAKDEVSQPTDKTSTSSADTEE